MSNQVHIKKTVYNKEEVEKSINRNFEAFQQNTSGELPSPIDISKFFQDYENLYFSIPPLGDSASHTYLVNRSSELLNIEKDTLDIQPLLDEIAQLREQLLQSQIDYSTAQQSIAELKSKQTTVQWVSSNIE